MARNVERSQERLQHSIDDGLGPDVSLGVLEEDGEFVATQPGSRVDVAHTRLDPACDGSQELVSCAVAEAVVDDFESVEIDEQDGNAGSDLAAGSPQCMVETIQQQCP